MNWELIVLPAVSMVIQDLIGTNLVISESKGRAVLAGLLDTFGWLLTITTTTISVDTLTGHDLNQKIAVVVAVSLANFFGTYSGTKIGHKMMDNKKEVSQ